MIHLAKEGVADEKIFFVGHVMIDSLIYFREKASHSKILEELGITPKQYILMTMHRPHNVDNEKGLRDILEIIKNAASHRDVVFAIHPRTESRYKSYGLYEELSNIEQLHLLPPQGYFEFLKLMDNAELIITDSGGIQEETTYLQVPCMTFRDSTERPVTVDLGTNFLMKDLNPKTVRVQMESILSGNSKKGTIPPLWDGKASERIANILVEKYTNK
jgi:UDP-N-acetylglucosamine 2-epimerase (non-hydrolysing)